MFPGFLCHSKSSTSWSDKPMPRVHRRHPRHRPVPRKTGSTPKRSSGSPTAIPVPTEPRQPRRRCTTPRGTRPRPLVTRQPTSPSPKPTDRSKPTPSLIFLLTTQADTPTTRLAIRPTRRQPPRRPPARAGGGAATTPTSTTTWRAVECKRPRR